MSNTMKMLNAVMEKYWVPKQLDFIFRKRYCRKHLEEFIKENKLGKRKDLIVAELPSICSVCNKGAICYYIEGKI